MSQLVEKAIAAIRDLDPDRQEQFAGLVLAEIEEEQRWSETLASKPHVLDRLVTEAREEIERGNASVLDPNSI